MKTPRALELRQQAEARLHSQGLPTNVTRSETETQYLLHELQVHQIELELQNEELRESRNEIERHIERYSSFYDFSPTSFVTVNRDGIIKQINLVGAQLLGLARTNLMGRRFGSFVAGTDVAVFSGLLNRLSETADKQSVELNLVAADQTTRFVHIDGRPSPNKQEYRLVVVDITERKNMETALAERKAELQHLYTRLQTLREDERSRFARELHDELGHVLTAMRMDLDWLDAKVPKDGSAISSKLTSAIALSDQVVDSARRIMEDLRPSSLNELGLVPCLEDCIAKFAARTGIRCDLETSHQEFGLSNDVATNIYRIVQEALNNVFKHARAANVSIRLTKAESGVVLMIQDDGTGLLEAVPDGREHFGVRGMRERVAILGGTLAVTSEPGHGVRVQVVVPTPPASDVGRD